MAGEGDRPDSEDQLDRQTRGGVLALFLGSAPNTV
jgi:hypothetical protein